MTRRTQILSSLAIFAVISLTAFPVEAAGLTETQVNKVLTLLKTFTKDEATITRVETALRGPVSEPSFCYTFSGNLKIGDAGAQVTALQTALQRQGLTVSVTGTFDTQTAFAVKAFQEKYASEVLTPNGLTRGTGYVGASTRAKLNGLYACVAVDPKPAFGLPFCAQPPMPACPQGVACAQVMPQPKTYYDYESFNKDKATFLYEKACVGGPLPPAATSTAAVSTAASLAASLAGGKLDYTGDAKIDQTDTQYLLEVAVGILACPVGKNCDLNKDGKVAASDALVLANYIGSAAKTGQFDYTNDYKIDVADSTLLAQIAVGSAVCGAGKQCDVNGDTLVNASDALLLSSYIGS